ncbi:MAG: hypothetical protein GXP32_07690 [Kiritimatiellaeota bacterium]|nr:hypothetical protein [Kiritimatiellota bacterium]
MSHALERFAYVVRDNSTRLPCNLIPAIGGETLRDAMWSCCSSSKNEAKVFLTSKLDRGKKVWVTLQAPFRGKAVCEISRGYASKGRGKPGFSEIKTTTATINLESVGESGQGIARIKTELSECLTIKVAKTGTSPPSAPVDFGSKKSRRARKFLTRLLKVSLRRPEAKLIRAEIRWPNGLFGFQGLTKRQAAFGMNEPPPERRKFKVRKGKWGHPYYAGIRDYSATRAEIDGVRNAVPWNDKSTLVRIAYPDGKPGRGEGVRLFFGGRNISRPDYLSFWVRPVSEIKTDKLRLRFFFDNRGKNLFLETFVKPEIWQRIVLPLKSGIEAPLWKDICVLGDPKLPEFRKGAMVSYEFNGFSVLSKPDELFAHREIVLKGTAAAPREMAFLFFGVPGTRGQYRRRFLRAVKIDALKLLTPMDAKHKPKLTYKRAAQILQVDVSFPVVPVSEWEKPVVVPAKLAPLLTGKERKLLLEDGLTAVALKFDLKR